MKQYRLGIGICFFALTLLLAGCNSSSRVTGHVYDSANDPINNAAVKFEQAGKNEEYFQSTRQTDPTGAFDISTMHSSFTSTPLRLTVTKEGYKTYQVEFTIGEAHQKSENKEQLKVILEKE